MWKIFCFGSIKPAEHWEVIGNVNKWIDEYFMLLRYGAGDRMEFYI